MPLSKQGFRNLIAQFVQRNPNHTKAAIVSHFVSSRSTIYAIIDKFRTRGGKGKIAKKMPIQLREKLICAATAKLGVSQRLLARKFDISKT